MIEPIAQLVAQLSRLPGIGNKTAQRLAFHIIGQPLEEVRGLAATIYQARKAVTTCACCGNFTDVQHPLCDVCSDSRRDQSIVCVVRDARDVLAIERMHDCLLYTSRCV